MSRGSKESSANNKGSHYQPGKRSGVWIKHRVNRGQKFVIGGYFPGPHGFDSLIVGYYDGDKLMYVARTRNGFVPASRRQVFSMLASGDVKEVGLRLKDMMAGIYGFGTQADRVDTYVLSGKLTSALCEFRITIGEKGEGGPND